MCYSAMVRADYQNFVREYRARLSIKDFYEIFWRRLEDRKLDVVRSAETAFSAPQTEDERAIHALIAKHAEVRLVERRADLQKQAARLEVAEAKLLKKVTKLATNEKRIALKKIPWLQGHIENLQRTHALASDSRFFPGEFVPMMLMQDGERVAEGRQSLQPGEKPGTVVVEFWTEPQQDLVLACVWARWSAPGVPDLLSFAIITDDPPPEVRAVGHDRCVVPIRPKDIDTWLQPEQSTYEQLDAILDPSARPFFRHAILGGDEPDAAEQT